MPAMHLAHDAQVWQTAHPVVSELAHLGLKPMVHYGFYHAWTDKRLNLQVIGHIQVRCCVCAQSPCIST